MKTIKIFSLSLLVLVLSLIGFGSVDSFAATSTGDQNTLQASSAESYVEYQYIDNTLYKLTFDDDGRLVEIEPVG